MRGFALPRRFGPGFVTSRPEEPMNRIVRRASSLAVTLVVAACSGGSAAAPSLSTASSPLVAPSPSAASPSAVASPSVEPSASAAATAVPSPSSFTSAKYGYTLTVPSGWSSTQATSVWDGSSALSSESAEVDKFVGPSSASSTGVAAPSMQTLLAYADALIAATTKYHGDTCPPRPEAQKRITIGGDPAILLEYNCGILINLAAVVHKGIGYQFLLRDPAVHASTDKSDQEGFLALLESVKFPD
jgi:hypothetical protein